MFRQPPRQRYWFSLLLIVSLFSSSILLPSTASAADKRRKPVVVTFGQPNIWSLEQAHYLLARMHMLNLDLQAKVLSADDLDPNATHGTRIQILKQLLEISGQFDQGAGFQNRRMVENARFNDTRRRELITHRSGLRDRALVLTGEISDLEIERARLETDKDATQEEKDLKDQEIKSKNKELAQVKELISQDTDELATVAQASSTPSEPNALPSPGQLPSSVLDALVKENAENLLKAARDPKLNATTMLDNTIQLQYEIVAKQLTLLRDEVGPGERLVFLELPQSIYTTPGDGDEKMAQSWWHVNGYTRTDPLLRLLMQLLEIELRWQKIRQVQAYQDRIKEINAYNCTLPPPLPPECKKDEQKKESDCEPEKEDDSLLRLFKGLKCEHESARKAALAGIYREANSLFARVEQNGARDTSEQIDLIRKMIALSKPRDKNQDQDKKKDATVKEVTQLDARSFGTEKVVDSTSSTIEKGRRREIDELKTMLLMVLSREDPLSQPSAKDLGNEKFKLAWEKFETFRQTLENNRSIGFEKAMEFIRLDEPPATNREGSGENSFDVSSLPRRTVRTVDIIPRQSSLNVNDIQETVKQTGILAGFKFLFGFAGSLNFQRRREQFEQFLHQELYASGFGKGGRDFGWTFGAVPGTKRVAPGVRTTYAALIVPDDAESVVVSARGCYFPRKNYQPLDYRDTAHVDWVQEQRYKRSNCSDEENYILTIPGGGDVSNFWVTNVDYEDGRKGGDFITVSVRGNNFSSQMGVLVDGVPLFPTIGLAQQHLMPRKAGANGADPPPLASECAGAQDICGRYERVDSRQIVFSFKMPDSYTGTPTITLIAPGKSVDLNGLINIRINGRSNVSLRDGAGVMFGTTGLSITTFEVSRAASSHWNGYLSGTGFDGRKDRIFVNGVEVNNPTFKSTSRYDISFLVPTDETLNVMVVRDKQVVSKSFPNPAVVKITSTTVVKYTPAVTKGKRKNPSVLLLKLNGIGFTNDLDLCCPGGTILSRSSTEMIVELTGVELPAVVTLKDRNTNLMASGIAAKENKEPKETEEKPSKPAPKPKTEPETKPKETEQKPEKPKQE